MAAPVISATSFSPDIWDDVDIAWTLATSTLSCGTITYTLRDASDDSEVTDAAFTLTDGNLAISGSETGLSYVTSPKTYYIEAVNTVGGVTEVTEDFTITFVNPCLTSTITNDGLSAMSVTVFGASDTQSVPATDSASEEYFDGGAAKCGARAFVLSHTDGSTDVSGFISMSGGVITLATNDLALEGTSWPLQVVVSLPSYPEVAPVTKLFTATIGVCIVTSVIPPTNPGPQSYETDTAALSISYGSYGFAPACGFSYSYEAVLIDENSNE